METCHRVLMKPFHLNGYLSILMENFPLQGNISILVVTFTVELKAFHLREACRCGVWVREYQVVDESKLGRLSSLIVIFR